MQGKSNFFDSIFDQKGGVFIQRVEYMFKGVDYLFKGSFALSYFVAEYKKCGRSTDRPHDILTQYKYCQIYFSGIII